MKGVGQRRGNTIPVSKSNSIHSTRPIQFSHKSSNHLKTQNMASSSRGGFDLIREAQNDGGYDSTNEDDEDTMASKRARHDLAGRAKYDKKGKAKAHKREAHEEASFEVGRGMRSKLLTMNAYDRHKSLINSYQLCFSGLRMMMSRAGRCSLPGDTMTSSSRNMSSLTLAGTKKTSLGCDGGLKPK